MFYLLLSFLTAWLSHLSAVQINIIFVYINIGTCKELPKTLKSVDVDSNNTFNQLVWTIDRVV